MLDCVGNLRKKKRDGHAHSLLTYMAAYPLARVDAVTVSAWPARGWSVRGATPYASVIHTRAPVSPYLGCL